MALLERLVNIYKNVKHGHCMAILAMHFGLNLKPSLRSHGLHNFGRRDFINSITLHLVYLKSIWKRRRLFKPYYIFTMLQ